MQFATLIDVVLQKKEEKPETLTILGRCFRNMLLKMIILWYLSRYYGIRIAFYILLPRVLSSFLGFTTKH